MSKDGGPAFPRPTGHYDEGAHGMTLRDWFAGQALAGIMTGEGDLPNDKVAAWAYSQADAMLAERDKNK